jgi:AraC-like DNA-binding protein
MGEIGQQQQLCIDLINNEYCSPYDEFQPTALRNLAVNLTILSPLVNYEQRIRSGHLLNYALQFMELVSSYIFTEKRKSFYAGRLGISEKMLAEALPSVYRKTFRDILVDKLLIEAMRMLVFTDKSVSQIALELDSDVSGLNKLFVRHKGITPKELRISYRKIIDCIENGQ